MSGTCLKGRGNELNSMTPSRPFAQYPSVESPRSVLLSFQEAGEALGLGPQPSSPSPCSAPAASLCPLALSPHPRKPLFPGRRLPAAEPSRPLPVLLLLGCCPLLPSWPPLLLRGPVTSPRRWLLLLEELGPPSITPDRPLLLGPCSGVCSPPPPHRLTPPTCSSSCPGPQASASQTPLLAILQVPHTDEPSTCSLQPPTTT